MLLRIYQIIIFSTFLIQNVDSQSVYRTLSSWLYSDDEQRVLEIFRTALEETAPDKILLVSEPNTIPAARQFEAVGLGIFDLLFTHASYHFETTKMGIVLDGFTGSPTELRLSGIWDSFDEHYRGHGLKLLSVMNTGLGYHLLLRNPTNYCNLERRLILTSPVFENFIRSLGSLPVVRATPSTQTLSKILNVDGVFAPIANHNKLRWMENSKLRVRPSVGTVNYLLLLNLKKWSALPSKEQKIFEEIGVHMENVVYKDRHRIRGNAEANLQQKNISSDNFCETDSVYMANSFINSLLDFLPLTQKGLTEKFKRTSLR